MNSKLDNYIFSASKVNNIFMILLHKSLSSASLNCNHMHRNCIMHLMTNFAELVWLLGEGHLRCSHFSFGCLQSIPWASLSKSVFYWLHTPHTNCDCTRYVRCKGNVMQPAPMLTQFCMNYFWSQLKDIQYITITLYIH